ncbi:hypothetical protein DRO34_04350 [Candidatus Bathyarchaeota archaeon]|nr:MAG: hypothetical protein DRO34_04350 [Candidatus Bathyarchaeota archaeon]
MVMDVKKIKWSWVTIDQVVHNKRCILYDTILIATSGGTADVAIYDGVNTTGKKLCKLYAPASDIRGLHPRVPIFLENGLYIDVGSNVEGVLVLSQGAE